MKNVIYILNKVPPGLPNFTFPTFEVSGPDNSTIGFGGMIESLGSGVFIIPLIAILENVAIAKAFCK